MAIEVTRRQLMASMGGMVLASFALPPALRKAVGNAPASALSARGSSVPPISEIKHVVVLMQENRSFDHYFGAMPGVRGFSDPQAIPGVFKQPDPQNPSGSLYPFHADTHSSSAQNLPSTSHNWLPQHDSWNNGAMNGFVTARLDKTIERLLLRRPGWRGLPRAARLPGLRRRQQRQLRPRPAVLRGRPASTGHGHLGHQLQLDRRGRGDVRQHAVLRRHRQRHGGRARLHHSPGEQLREPGRDPHPRRRQPGQRGRDPGRRQRLGGRHRAADRPARAGRHQGDLGGLRHGDKDAEPADRSLADRVLAVRVHRLRDLVDRPLRHQHGHRQGHRPGSRARRPRGCHGLAGRQVGLRDQHGPGRGGRHQRRDQQGHQGDPCRADAVADGPLGRRRHPLRGRRRLQHGLGREHGDRHGDQHDFRPRRPRQRCPHSRRQRAVGGRPHLGHRLGLQHRRRHPHRQLQRRLPPKRRRRRADRHRAHEDPTPGS